MAGEIAAAIAGRRGWVARADASTDRAPESLLSRDLNVPMPRA